MVIVVLLIPLRFNDGTSVDKGLLEAIQERLWRQFGGITIEGIVTGHWVDQSDGCHYQDKSMKVKLAIDLHRLDEVKEEVIEIGRKLKQKAMYFEIQKSEVTFLRI